MSLGTFSEIHTYIHRTVCCLASSFHRIISLGTACGDSVFCCSGTASGDSCQFFSFRLFISLGTACGESVFCFVTDFCESSGAASGDPFVPFDFIASFLLAPPVATQFSVVGHRKCRPSDRQTDRQADPCKKHILFSSSPSSSSDYYKFSSSLFCLLVMFFLCVSWLGLKTPGKL